MFDIADKEQLIQAILGEIGYSSFNGDVYTIDDLKNLKTNIENVVDEHTNKVVRCIINHLYTHSEFEKDIGIIE